MKDKKINIQIFATQPASIQMSSSVNAGGSVTIGFTPHLSTNRYKLILQINGPTPYSQIIAQNISGNSYNWSVPASLAAYIKDSQSASAILICETYYMTTSISNNLIGRTQKQFVLVVPNNSTFYPTINVGTIEEANSKMLSFSPRWNVYVQNHSQLKIPFTIAGKYGTNIKQVKIIVDEKTYTKNYDNSSVDDNQITSIITTSGTKTIQILATDGRGNHRTITQNVTIQAYSNPEITDCDCERTGTDNNKLQYTFKGNITNVGNNAHTFKIGYKLRSNSSYTYKTIVDNAYTINKENQTLNDWTLSADNTFDIIFVAEDSFTKSDQRLELSSEGDLINFNATGTSIALGKVSEAGANDKKLEVALETYLLDKLYLYDSTNNQYIPIEVEVVDTW